jgi:seryl-tRNA synthetase
MLTLNLIREKTDEVIHRLQVKNFDAKSLVQEIVALDEERRTTQNKLDGNRHFDKIKQKRRGRC